MKFSKQKKTDKKNGRIAAGEQRHAQVFSYYANRTPREASSRHNEIVISDARTWWHYLPSAGAGAIIVLCGLYNTSLTTQPRIIYRNQGQIHAVRDAAYYQDALGSLLDKSLFNRNKLTINTDDRAQEIVAQYPELADAAISLPLVGRRPVIQLTPARPILELETNNGAVLLDSNGRAIIRARDAMSSERNVSRVTDETGIPAEVGKIALPREHVAFISEVIKQLEDKKISIDSALLPSISNELHIKIAGKPYTGKFNLQGDARQQAGVFLATKQRLENDKSEPSEYIDVRVEDKAYVR